MTDSTSLVTSPGFVNDAFKVAGGDRLEDELLRLPLAARHVASLLLVVLATGFAIACERLIAPPNLSLIFVLPVILSATMFGWGPSLTAVVGGVLAFDFFFTEPRYSFVIASRSDLWAAALLFVVATVVSATAAQSRQRAEEAHHAAAGARALQALAHMVIQARPRSEVLQAAAVALNQAFAAPAVIFLERAGRLSPVATAGDPAITRDEDAAARHALESGRMARADTYPSHMSRFDFWPVETPSGAHCVVGVDFGRAIRRRPAAPEHVVDIVAAYLAMSPGGRDQVS